MKCYHANRKYIQLLIKLSYVKTKHFYMYTGVMEHTNWYFLMVSQKTYLAIDMIMFCMATYVIKMEMNGMEITFHMPHKPLRIEIVC